MAKKEAELHPIEMLIILFGIVIILGFFYFIEIEPFTEKFNCVKLSCSGTPHTLGYNCECFQKKSMVDNVKEFIDERLNEKGGDENG